MSQIQIVEDQMKKVIQKLQADFSAMRTGRAHISLVEGLKVEHYGSVMPLNQVASLAIVDGRSIEIKPWDKEALKPIETAILKSDLGMTPLNDGKLLRLTMPAPTTERKKEIIRLLHKQSESFRVMVRNVRRDAVEALKKEEKDKKISQDDLRRSEQQVQKLTDQYVKTVDDLLATKELEVLEV